MYFDILPLAPLVNVTTLNLSFNHIYQGVPTFAVAPFTSNPAIDMSENTYLYCGMDPAMYTLTCGELTTLITNVGARGGAVTPNVATPGLNCDWGVMVCGCADIPPAPGC